MVHRRLRGDEVVFQGRIHPLAKRLAGRVTGHFATEPGGLVGPLEEPPGFPPADGAVGAVRVALVGTKQWRISGEPEAPVLDILLDDGGSHRVERMLKPGPLPFDGAPLDVDVLEHRAVVEVLNPERQQATDPQPALEAEGEKRPVAVLVATGERIVDVGDFLIGKWSAASHK